jgi:RES domain-containing protein
MAKRHEVPGATLLWQHPESDRIASGIRRCLRLAVSWGGVLFRATGHDYANRRDVVTGEGSRIAGARFTPRGAFRAVYGSLDMETALAESLANHRRLGLPDAEALPLTFVALRAAADGLLDLTRPEVRRALGVSRERLLGPWRHEQARGREALTQAVGRLSRAAGLPGILYPSAQRRGGRNAVLFPELLPPGGLEVIHPERLPARRRRNRP